MKRFVRTLVPFLVIGASFPIGAAAAQEADRIWHGGPIITMNDTAMRAEAVAVKDGRIIAVGGEAEVMKSKGAETVVTDLAGRTLLPGFVDAHGHIFGGGVQALSANLLPPPDGPIKDIASVQEALRTWAAENKEAVEKIQLIVGFGYDNTMLAELRHPTREDLDAVSREIPVILIHQSGHMMAMNSKGLEAVGITAASKDPTGGVIRRQAGSQEPDGVLEETAHFAALVKLLGRAGPEGAATFARAGAELWASFGYTTAQEGRSTPGVVKTLQAVAETGGFKIDVVSYADILVDRNFIKDQQSDLYTNRFRVGGAKLTIDGSAPGFTAWRDRPYHEPVGNYPPRLRRLSGRLFRTGDRSRRLGVRQRHPVAHPL